MTTIKDFETCAELDSVLILRTKIFQNDFTLKSEDAKHGVSTNKPHAERR
jgi:hypothetical protein